MNTKGFVFNIIGLIIFSSYTHAFIKTSADTCTDVDLRNEFIGEVRDQGEIQWCYAYTASDLMSYTYRLPRVSASDMAILYNQSKIAKIMKTFIDIGAKKNNPSRYHSAHETGFINIALKRAMKYGVCDEKDFASEYMIKIIKKENGIDRIKVPTLEAQLQIATLRSKIISGYYKDKKIPYYFEIAGLTEEDFYNILKNSRRKKVWNNLRKVACDNRMYVRSQRVRSYIRGRKTFKRVNIELSRDNLVAIDYSSNILKNADSKNPLKNLHTSSIVGRRFKDNQCQYLVRDSHGPDCSKYDPRYQCEKGHVWIPESNLFKSLARINFIDI